MGRLDFRAAATVYDFYPGDRASIPIGRFDDGGKSPISEGPRNEAFDNGAFERHRRLVQPSSPFFGQFKDRTIVEDRLFRNVRSRADSGFTAQNVCKAGLQDQVVFRIGQVSDGAAECAAVRRPVGLSQILLVVVGAFDKWDGSIEFQVFGDKGIEVIRGYRIGFDATDLGRGEISLPAAT